MVLRARWLPTENVWEATKHIEGKRFRARSKKAGELGKKEAEDKLRKLVSGEETFSAGTLGEFVERVWRPSLLVKERAYSTLTNYELALKSDISQLYPIPLNQLRIEVLTEFLIGP